MKTTKASADPKDVLAQNLKSLRTAGGYTQVDFAKKLGLSQADLSRLELAKRGFSTESLSAISNALGCEPWELLKPGVDFVPTWSSPADTIPSSALSPSAIPGPISASDCAVILARLSEVGPDRRAAALAILFDDSSLAPESLAVLAPLLSTIG